MSKQDDNKNKGLINNALNVAKQIKEQMKDFYKHQSSSQVDLQNMIKGRGFGYLRSDVEERETIVKLQYIDEFVQQYLRSLRKILTPKLFQTIKIFFEGIKKVEVKMFKKI